jgi:hypothetical protein
MSESDGRYHSITLEPDDMAKDGTHRLKFSTMPGMSMTVGDLHSGDLGALAHILAGNSLLPDGMALVAFDPADAVSIIRALRDAVTADVLRVVAHAELTR